MSKLILFTDGSWNAQKNNGYGAYLMVGEHELSFDSFGTRIKVKRFENSSSTKLELQTLIWALAEIQKTDQKIVVYTDSQNIIGLPARRSRLELNDYRSRKNELLNNHALYREFYRLTDLLDCEWIKVHGHLSSNKKDDFDRFFTLVDRASRKALKEDSQSL